MKNIVCLLALFICGCYSEKHQDVGDIKFDANIDQTEFHVCDENLIKQYYIRHSTDTAPSYPGEKRGLENDVLGMYSYPISASENGYITIRFVVNCRGEAGRFRKEEMDFSYEPKTFDPKLSKQLLEIVKNLKTWTPRKRNNKAYDFYQYLTFKIEAGQITKILP